MLKVPVRRLVFVDETGTNTAMTARYGRAPRGRRSCGRAPRNYGPNVTVVAAMRLGAMGPAMVLDGALTSAGFEAYVTQLLVPWLEPQDIVVLDNLSAHTSPRTRQTIVAAGATLHFLPPYSPDFNPIEGGMSKLKAGLRRVGARTREALVRAIADGLDAITAADIHGWFHGCGYVPARQRL